jgi:hypothetical protein
VHPTVIAHWKRQLLERAPEVFPRGPAGSVRREDDLTALLYQEIGRLKMEVEWPKKQAVSAPPEGRREWIHGEPSALSIVQQCALAGLARSTYSYDPTPEREENLVLRGYSTTVASKKSPLAISGHTFRSRLRKHPIQTRIDHWNLMATPFTVVQVNE